MLKAIRSIFATSPAARQEQRSTMSIASASKLHRGRVARIFDAAKIDRNTEGWHGDLGLSHNDVRSQLVTIRNRAREACKNDPYLVQYLASIRNDIVGANGISFRADVADYRKGAAGDWEKVPDKMANGIIRTNWELWADCPDFVTANGRADLVMAQWQVVKDWAREGESIWEMLPGFRLDAGNPYGFSIQRRRPDSLAIEHCADLGNGNSIYNGVEVDPYGRPLAYWFWTKMMTTGQWTGEKIRIPAERILHVYDEDYVGITRGFPLVACVLRSLKILHGYDEAEVIKARDQASKVGVYEARDGAFDPSEIADPQDEDQRDQFQQYHEPGEDKIAPKGWSYSHAPASAPNPNYPSFKKAVLQRVASGLEAEYTVIGNDLEGVNFSSIRHGKMDSRESRKCQQRIVIQQFMSPMFRRRRVGWLSCFLLSGQSPLPYSKFDRFAKDTWRGRRWPYMDPIVEAQANEIMVKHGHVTDSQIADEMGENWEENIATVKAEQEMAKGTPIEKRFMSESEKSATIAAQQATATKESANA